MRYRLLASYQGAPYEAGIGPGETGVVLFAACPPPEELHFEPATGHWRKSVRRRDVQSLYESRPVGLFRGERCVVLDDLGDRLHIAYLGHDALKADELGYWEVDRGVFELIAPRQQVTEVVEERLPVTEGGSGHSASYFANGHRAADPAPGSGLPGEDADPLSGPSVPRTSGLPGYGRGGSVTGPLGLAGPVPIPADDAPLPLEAEAMRAAAEATRRGKEGYQDQDRSAADPVPPEPDSAEAGSPEAGTPVIPASPAGLSEPSVATRVPGAGPGAVPSWMPAPAPRPVPAKGAGHAPDADAPAQEEMAPAAGDPEEPALAVAELAEPAPALPGLGYRGRAGAAARNGTYGHAAAQALAEPQALDPDHQDRREQPDNEPRPAGPGADPQAATAVRPAAAADGDDAPREPSDPAVPVSTLVAAPTTSPESTQAAAPAATPASTAAQARPAGTSPASPAATPAGEPRPQDPPRTPAASEASGARRDESRASRRRRSARRRLPTQRIFSELADQAGIRPQAYAIGEDTDGAMCLVQTPDGFEVFNSLGGARHEVRLFADEESAYFYLFGVLAAEAVRTGTLGVTSPQS